MKPILAVACVLLIGCSIASTQTTNYSHLVGRELRSDLKPEDLLMNLAFSGSCNGTVSKIKVTEDTETQLTLSVTYTEAEGCFLKVALVENNRTPVTGLKPFTQKLTQKGGTIEAKFVLEPQSHPVNEEFAVPSVYCTVGQDENSAKFYRYSFALDKKFKLPPGNQDIITDVTMTPLASAAGLPATRNRSSAVPLPRIKIYDKLERVRDEPKTLKTSSLYLKNLETSKLNLEGNTTTPVVTVAKPRMELYKPRYVERVSGHMGTLLHPPATTTTPTPSTDRTPQGPGDMAIPLFESLVTDYDFEYPFEVTNIRLDVYPDKNKASGVFYFIPCAYNLLFDKDRGLQFVIDYGTATSADTGATVRMAGKLTPGIGKKEIDVVRELVRAYVRRNPQLGYPAQCELRAIQIDGSPSVNFDSDLQQYNISNQTVNATSLSEPIDVSWRTNQNNATDISNSLKANVGIIGTMTMKPQGGTLADQTIPIRIRLADERTIGRFTLVQGWREQSWRNVSPYPIKLKNLHVLWVNGDTPAVYTWTLGDKEILPGSQVHFHGETVPSWLDAESYARFWLEYEILNCETCHDSVIRSVIHSTVQSQAQQVKFKFLTFFQEFHLNTVAIAIRTKQADASGDNLQTLPAIEATKDGQDYLSAKIYVPPDGQPDFEYQLSVILDDGTMYESSWQKRTTLLIPIGSAQIKELFPQLAH